MVNGKGGEAHQSVEKTDPLPGMQIGTYCGFNDGAKTAYVWNIA